MSIQGLTMAIGQKGITFLTDNLISGAAVKKLQDLTPADNSVKVPNFSKSGVGYGSDYSDFVISLSNGRMNGFAPAFSSVVQAGGGTPAGNDFTMTLTAPAFSVTYDWSEHYSKYTCIDTGDMAFPACDTTHPTSNYTYTPSFSGMTVTVPITMAYNSGSNTYSFTVSSARGTAHGPKANIPGKSAVNGETSDGCFKTKVSDATSNSVSSIDFDAAVGQILNGMLKAIDANPSLGDGIAFNYAVGPSLIGFNQGDGVTIGATGVASYNGTAYSGPNPPTLPIPAVPVDSDDHFMNIYVSDWSINGLSWAYFEAGKLSITLQPSDLPNPDALKAATYAAFEPAFKQYGNVALSAQIAALGAPVTVFQEVWLFTTAVMDLLKTQLPASVYGQLAAFSGDAYVSQNALETALSDTGIDKQYFATIESASQQKGKVTTQKMQFEILVENGANPLPNLVFELDRTDVMTDLLLGTTASNAQSMMFKFTNVSNTVTFKSTTIPGFSKQTFGSFVWPVVGESAYAAAMTGMGQRGVAIPIAQGFSFLLTASTLSIQDGYISISTQLEFKPSLLHPQLRALVYSIAHRVDERTGRVTAHPLPIAAE